MHVRNRNSSYCYCRNGDPKTKLTTHSYNQVGYKCLRLSHLFPLEDNRT